jgi:cytochrome c biogenesis protein
VKTGVILLILVVIISSAGTVILQRPATDPEEMQRAYSPQVLHFIDAIGLTDTFHAWWFVLLLSLVSLSIFAASVQRFPNAWRFYSRPYRSPDENFRKALPTHKLIPIQEEEASLVVAERALQKAGFRPDRIVRENSFSLFGERHRISEMAVYIVHASLLFILVGGNIDAIFGWRGFVTLTRGQQARAIQVQNGKTHELPFAIRCDGAGQENYADGTPKRWWSDLVVVKDGREVLRKQIVVNDPLVFGGVRFYQASYGRTGKLDKLILTAVARDGHLAKDVPIGVDETVVLDADTSVRLAEFFPDYVVSDGHVYTRSKELENPAAHLVVDDRKTGKTTNVWLPPISGFEENAAAPYSFEGKDLQMADFTGLEASHEPGQWAVWTGVILMGLGLAVVFYLVHARVWVVPVRDARGQLQLWIGGTANRNKEAFEQRFRDLVGEIESQLKLAAKPGAEAPEAVFTGR